MNRQRYLEIALGCRREGETFLESLAALGSVRDVTIGRASHEVLTGTVSAVAFGRAPWFVRAALHEGGEVVCEASRLEDAALLTLVEVAARHSE